MIYTVHDREFQIDVKGFSHLRYGAVPWNETYFPNAKNVIASKTPQKILASPREIVAYRIAVTENAKGPDNRTDTEMMHFANQNFLSRATAIYTWHERRWVAMIDDIMDSDLNILYQFARKGSNANEKYGKLIVKKDNPLIAAALRRAESSSRWYDIPIDKNSIEVNTTEKNKKSKYANEAAANAILEDMVVASMEHIENIGKWNYGYGDILDITTASQYYLQDLEEKLILRKNEVFISPILMGYNMGCQPKMINAKTDFRVRAGFLSVRTEKEGTKVNKTRKSSMRYLQED